MTDCVCHERHNLKTAEKKKGNADDGPGEEKSSLSVSDDELATSASDEDEQQEAKSSGIVRVGFQLRACIVC